MCLCKKIAKKILEILYPDYLKLRSLKITHKEKMMNIQKRVDVPEEEYPAVLQEFYLKCTGSTLDLKNPKRYNEKIQWRKLYDINEIYSVLSDKYAVRAWVEKKIGSEYLIPLLGVWDRTEDINFERLPDQFVLKTNNASSTNIIVTDKKRMNRKIILEQLSFWLEYPFYLEGLELHYKSIVPRIIAEKYMQPEEGKSDLNDYKFMCFKGKPRYCWVDLDRYHGHKRKVYTLDWKPADWTIGNYGGEKIDIPKPSQFDKMISLVETLCDGFEFVRVDMYEIRGKVYFGEMTFTSCSGIDPIRPDEWDYKIGELWDVSKNQVDRDKIGL